jgi:phenylpropionate dioxygenase-like ring-hydroxylating dioxygenase large terminal subunit
MFKLKMSDEEVVEIMTTMTSRLDGKGIRNANRATMVDLAERLIALAAEGRPEMGDEYLEVPASQYTDPEIFAAERRAIFDRTPFVAGLSFDIPKPGDYLRIDDFGTPTLVTRNKAGQIRAYVNSCRHRGAALVYDDRGSAGAGFTCPYHAWSYDLDGKLKGISCNSSFGEPDKSELGLVPLDATERHGIIFVAPKPGLTIDWDEFIGPELDAELPHWGFDKVQGGKVAPIPLEGNWKLVLETFLESYHFNYAHKDNLAQYYNGNVNTVDMLGRHLRTVTSLKTIVTELAKKPKDDWVPEDYIHVKYVLFPGTVMINTSQVLEFYQIVPVSVDKSIVRHASYSRTDLSEPANAAMYERVWESAHTVVQKQDFPYGVSTAHAALKAGGIPKLVFGRNEWALQIMHKEIRKAVAAATN